MNRKILIEIMIFESEPKQKILRTEVFENCFFDEVRPSANSVRLCANLVRIANHDVPYVNFL